MLSVVDEQREGELCLSFDRDVGVENRHERSANRNPWNVLASDWKGLIFPTFGWNAETNRNGVAFLEPPPLCPTRLETWQATDHECRHGKDEIGGTVNE